MESLREILKKYNAIDITMNIAGNDRIRYFIPDQEKNCPEIYRIPMAKLNEMMQSEGIESILFASWGDNVSVFSSDKNNFNCKHDSRHRDYFNLKFPEDSLRLMELLYPEKSLPSIYG